MKKRKFSHDEFHIQTIYDPYRIDDNETFDVIYQRYLEDTEKTIDIDGVTYYKAMTISKINFCEKRLNVVLPLGFNIRSGDIIIDENGNQYEYQGCATMSFGGKIPEWYFNTLSVILSYSDDNIGTYFAVNEITLNVT